METIGFPNSNAGGVCHTATKAHALKWCLDNKPFLQVNGAFHLFPDRDHCMLIFLFPHLDLWGIGGFHNPNRSSSQCLSFEHQLHNLLMLYDLPFLKGPNFMYVRWNIM